eukprot:7389376-Prymnesium_polylepis.1
MGGEPAVARARARTLLFLLKGHRAAITASATRCRALTRKAIALPRHCRALIRMAFALPPCCRALDSPELARAAAAAQLSPAGPPR